MERQKTTGTEPTDRVARRSIHRHEADASFFSAGHTSNISEEKGPLPSSAAALLTFGLASRAFCRPSGLYCLAFGYWAEACFAAEEQPDDSAEAAGTPVFAEAQLPGAGVAALPDAPEAEMLVFLEA